MALVVATLNSQLLKIVNNPDAFPSSYEEAGQIWSEAINAYASLVTPPSVTSAVAQQAFVAAWIANKPSEDLSILVSAISAYAASLALGMAPTFVGTPPLPIAEQALLAGLKSLGEAMLQAPDASVWSSTASTLIDTYFKTGVAVNSASGATITWL